MNDERKKMTIIVFSNDFDKAMAALILATGAASAAIEVTMYFTFWGLSLLRKEAFKPSGKSFIDRMFGWVLPKGPEGTRLSKMHFLGVGTSMMKGVMRTKKMPQLGELMDMAVAMNVRMVACTTSMSIMGISREELIDRIEIGGVATYLGTARDSAINLFV